VKKHELQVYPGGAEDLDEAERGPVSPRVRRVAERFRALMEELGLDLDDADLADTPQRVARAYEEMFAGLRPGGEPRIRTFPNVERYSQMVALVDIPFYSVCAHHFLPFFGSAHVAYLPADRIVGLSKLARVVDAYARRPQIQERMTEQVMGALVRRLRPKGAMVILQARHLCMEMRGVNKPGAITTTSAIHGAFVEDRVRQELLALIPDRPGAA
jgi:GTP cyclohydrolase I